ncbi:MAG: hypothetical protein KFB96_04870 [Thiocapsa sp.]|nr:hypothetical protein [Thiocapsa sp.]QVL49824.1 MAG: hypothetical protein KFB96_04870 [Thiocapsa sp.]
MSERIVFVSARKKHKSRPAPDFSIPQGERTLIREALGNSPEDSGSRIT